MDRFRVDCYNNIVIEPLVQANNRSDLSFANEGEKKCQLIHNDLKGSGDSVMQFVTFASTDTLLGPSSTSSPSTRRFSMVARPTMSKQSGLTYSSILNISRTSKKVTNCRAMRILKEESCHDSSSATREHCGVGRKTDEFRRGLHVQTQTKLLSGPVRHQSSPRPHTERTRHRSSGSRKGHKKSQSDGLIDTRMLHLSQRKTLEEWMQQKLEIDCYAMEHSCFTDEPFTGKLIVYKLFYSQYLMTASASHLCHVCFKSDICNVRVPLQ